MKMNTAMWIDICHTKARYYQAQASKTLNPDHLADAKAWLGIAQHLQDIHHEQLVQAQHSTAPLDCTKY